jgi:hypothetical protein
MTEQRDEELEAAIRRVVGAAIGSERGDDLGDEGRYDRAHAALRTLIARKVAEARERALREVQDWIIREMANELWWRPVLLVEVGRMLARDATKAAP